MNRGYNLSESRPPKWRPDRRSTCFDSARVARTHGRLLPLGEVSRMILQAETKEDVWPSRPPALRDCAPVRVLADGAGRLRAYPVFEAVEELAGGG